uniref:Uncharacterized protein n=1 Tax=Eutreptiella gymnastica TaxID=73025 RepID=A0A7S4LIG4_9EUGL
MLPEVYSGASSSALFTESLLILQEYDFSGALWAILLRVLYCHLPHPSYRIWETRTRSSTLPNQAKYHVEGGVDAERCAWNVGCTQLSSVSWHEGGINGVPGYPS